jgi:hypothetical protein
VKKEAFCQRRACIKYPCTTFWGPSTPRKGPCIIILYPYLPTRIEKLSIETRRMPD